MIDLFIEFIIMTIKDIILVREQSLTFFKDVVSILDNVICLTYQDLYGRAYVSFVLYMTYQEFYGSDYDTFKNVLDKVLNTIHSSSLVCIQYTTSRIKSPQKCYEKDRR